MIMHTTTRTTYLHETAAAIYRTAIAAVAPEVCLGRWLHLDRNILSIGPERYDLNQIGRLYLIGMGKASAPMAAYAENLLGNRITDGVIITKYHHGVALKRCRLMEAGHPVPDENGIRATEAMLHLIAGATPDDLILCLISGGGSALAPAPAPGLSLADKQETTHLLLSCGATINELNTVRKHLSRIKGGQLCQSANGARIISLILSDVIGDDLDTIASGATAGDDSTFGDCLDIITRYGLKDQLPVDVTHHLERGSNGKIADTPAPDDAIFNNVRNHIVGSISDALNAAEKEAKRHGFQPLVLTSMICGEAREVARSLCAVAREIPLSGRPLQAPACLLSGGETTVTIKGSGHGGRNMEFALAAALELQHQPGIMLLSAGTDGTDGPTDAAGAFADDTTVQRARNSGLSASVALSENNSYRFFSAINDLFVTGPTRTNVMDLQIFLIDGQ